MTTQQPQRRRISFSNLIIALINLYLFPLIGWGIAAVIFADRWWWLFLLNTVSFWLFLPLLLIIPAALILRRRPMLVSTGIAMILAVTLLGGMVRPLAIAAPAASEASLRVMTLNVYAGNTESALIMARIRNADADLVALQELSPVIATILERELQTEYPYMLLEPDAGVIGLGVLSRYPFQHVGTLPGEGWFGKPQVLEVQLNEEVITVVNVHTIPPIVAFNGSHTEGVRERERQIAAIVALAKERSEPFIALGDFNMTMHHEAYRIITAELYDAWSIQGGTGFTWNALGQIKTPEQSQLLLTRIDYIFHSDEWQTHTIEVDNDPSGSDHVPLIATLYLAR